MKKPKFRKEGNMQVEIQSLDSNPDLLIFAREKINYSLPSTR